MSSSSSNHPSTVQSTLNELNGESPYNILNLPPTASQKEIKSQFRTLALSLHPDRTLHTTNGTNTKFNKVKLAYDILSNTQLRTAYDMSILQPEFQSPMPRYATPPPPQPMYNTGSPMYTEYPRRYTANTGFRNGYIAGGVVFFAVFGSIVQYFRYKRKVAKYVDEVTLLNQKHTDVLTQVRNDAKGRSADEFHQQLIRHINRNRELRLRNRPI